MHRIDTESATEENLFTSGDAQTGVPATVVSDDWMNDVQENIMAVIEAAGVSPTKGRDGDNDLLNALKITGWVSAPANASSSGTAGQRAYDSSYLYICIATNTWRRIAHNTW